MRHTCSTVPGRTTRCLRAPGLFQDNGGPKSTLALLQGSVAINGGDPAGCKDENGSPLATNQRGPPRLGPCDIGAYEIMLRVLLPLIWH
jgi:hypothetical protein